MSRSQSSHLAKPAGAAQAHIPRQQPRSGQQVWIGAVDYWLEPDSYPSLPSGSAVCPGLLQPSDPSQLDLRVMSFRRLGAASWPGRAVRQVCRR
jgi:hypothetical protein